MTATTATTVIASAGWFQTFTKQTSYRSPSMFCHHQLFSLSLSLATHISTPYAYEKYLAYLVGRDRHHVVHVVPGHPECLSSRGSHRRPVREQAHLHHIACCAMWGVTWRAMLRGGQKEEEVGGSQKRQRWREQRNTCF